MIFSRLLRPASSSSFALAAVLATTGLFAVTAAETPAHAQKKKKDDQKGAEKANYSKEFVAVYQPLAQQVEAGADVATFRGQIPALTAAATTADDRFVAGNMILQIAQKTKDEALQRQGLETMLQSGKVPAANLGQYNMIAGQLAYNAKDYPAARTYFETALANGYAEGNPQAMIAETYFQNGQQAEGLTYLAQAIEARKAAGQPVDEKWIKRGLSVAYTNKLADQTSQYNRMLVANSPTAANWADAVAIVMGGANYPNPEVLDLMRLARATDAMRDEGFYADYAEAADYRKNPGEVVAIIDEAKAAGKLGKSAAFLNDIRSQAVGRAVSDKKDLPNILKSAQGSSDAKTIVNGADLALSYGDYPAAELLYTKAMNMPGVDKGLVQTRLGIAQLEQGKTAQAKASFGSVTGTRAPIAQLWSIHAEQQGG